MNFTLAVFAYLASLILFLVITFYLHRRFFKFLVKRKSNPMLTLRVIGRLNVGGPAQHVIYLTERMNQGPYRTVLVKGSESKGEGTMEALAHERGVNFVYVPELGRELSFRGDIVSFWKLFRLLRRERPGVLHTHTAKAGTLGRLAGLFYRWTTPEGRDLKVFHTFHGHVLGSGYFSLATRSVYLLVERILARTATTKVITLSERLRDELVNLRVAPLDHIAVVPISLELDDFLAVGDSENGKLSSSFRISLNVPTEAFLVGTVGRLVAVKDHETLLEAVSLMLGEGLDVHLAIVGGGEGGKVLKRRAQELLPGDRAHFLGWRSDLPDIYNDLDVFVLSSLHEGTPVSLIEAMAAARPVVATAVGGVPDLLGFGDTNVEGLAPGEVVTAEWGLLVRPKDPQALAKGLRQIKDDPQAATERAQAARDYVAKKFTVERLVANLSALYQQD